MTCVPKITEANTWKMRDGSHYYKSQGACWVIVGDPFRIEFDGTKKKYYIRETEVGPQPEHFRLLRFFDKY